MLQLHLGVLLLGVAALFAKLIDLPALDIIAYRSLLTMFILVTMLKVFKQPIRLRSGRDYKVAVILGVLAAIHWLTYFMSVQMTSVSVGMITLFTYPVMTILLEPLLRKQLPKGQDLLISLVVLFAISLLFPGFWQDTADVSEHIYLGHCFRLSVSADFRPEKYWYSALLYWLLGDARHVLSVCH